MLLASKYLKLSHSSLLDPPMILDCVKELMLTEIGDTCGTQEAHLIMVARKLIMVVKPSLKWKIGTTKECKLVI